MPLKKLKKPFEAYGGDKPYVFVSYTHQDKEAVYIELVQLKKLGFNVWYDEGISPGSRWSDDLAERIANCALFLYYVTPRSVASTNCQDEASYVLEAGNPFLAVHLEETELPPGLQLRMGPRQAILRYELEPGTYQSKLLEAIVTQSAELVQTTVDLTQGFRLGNYRIEALAGAVTDPDGNAQHLEPKVMDVLIHLAEHANELVARDELLDAVWSGQVAADELLTRAVSEIRRALRDGRGESKMIETVPKRGYRLIGKIHTSGAAGLEMEPPEDVTVPISIVAQEETEPVEATTDRSRRRKIAAFGLSVLAAVLMGATIIELMPVPPPPLVSDYKQLSTSQLILPPTPSPLPLVADASRIYFNDSYVGRLGVQQLAQAGGEASRVELPFYEKGMVATPLTMSPDGSQLLFVTFFHGKFSEGELWVWPVVGGNPRHLGKGVDAAYSPDGSKLLYANNKDEIYLANPDLSEPRLLATAPGSVYWPRFSPDGRRIRFTVSDDYRSLYEMAADGTGLHRVLPEWSDIDHCCGSWTPDGNDYVFHAAHDYRTKLWAIRERQGIFGRRQSEPVRISTGALDFRRPTFAADGKRIFAIGWQLRGEVVRYDDVSERFIPMLDGNSLSGEWLDFSTDKEWMAYVSHPEASLWRSRSDGTDRMQLTFPPMRVFTPAWSPDGKTLAFTGLTSGEGWKTYLMSSDGGAPQAITTSNTHNGGPTWSPNGKFLAFNETGNDFIRILDITTGTLSNLEGSAGLLWPRWSPDGGYIAAYANNSLHLFNVDEGRSEKLIELEEYEGHFWSKDSQYIYYSDPFYSGGDRSIHRVRIGDKTSEKIATVGNIQMAWGMWGPWIGISPDGAPLALRDLSIHHIYALDWQAD